MKFINGEKITKKTIIAGLAVVSMAVSAAIVAFSYPETLSENSFASKTKLVRMGNGWLISVYGDAAGPDVYDTKQNSIRPARDIFVRACHPGNPDNVSKQCSSAEDWSDPVNISRTAGLSSMSTKWVNGDTSVYPFYGDSDKPNIFNAGNFAVVTWVDKYCAGGNQRAISYYEREGITVPFSCVYAAYTNNIESGDWNTVQLTDGNRDAKSDSSKGLSVGTPAVGKWAISWQEDPHGLQLGGADGPGEGASGATVTHGTDIWYTYTDDLMNTPWAIPLRISDNYTKDGSSGHMNPVYDRYGEEVTSLEQGIAGAARPNLMLVAGTVPTAVIAYEESKGASLLDYGKYIRYHNFNYNSPPSAQPGCIISDPLENSRRVRFVSQPNASANGLRMAVFWRQGLPTGGGPGDVMVRLGMGTAGTSNGGLSPSDMLPAVADGCEVSDYALAKELANQPASNLSCNTIPWSSVDGLKDYTVSGSGYENSLSDTTSLNSYEDARAHRAAIVGDDLYIGYSYTKDWGVSTYTDLDNYNFFVRHYNQSTQLWGDAINVSNIVDTRLNVKEPRLVKTPGNGPGCTDPTNITYAENCQDKNTLIVAWGEETNVYSHVESSEELDINYTKLAKTDTGIAFDSPIVVPNGVNNRFESQLRPSPAGNIIWSVWNESSSDGTYSMLSVSDNSRDDQSVPKPPVLGDVPGTPSDDIYDVRIDSLDIPDTTIGGLISAQAMAISDITINVVLTLTGVSNRGEVLTYTTDEIKLLAAVPMKFYIELFDSSTKPTTYRWTAEVTALSDGEDSNPINNTMETKSKVRQVSE